MALCSSSKCLLTEMHPRYEAQVGGKFGGTKGPDVLTTCRFTAWVYFLVGLVSSFHLCSYIPEALRMIRRVFYHLIDIVTVPLKHLKACRHKPHHTPTISCAMTPFIHLPHDLLSISQLLRTTHPSAPQAARPPSFSHLFQRARITLEIHQSKMPHATATVNGVQVASTDTYEVVDGNIYVPSSHPSILPPF